MALGQCNVITYEDGDFGSFTARTYLYAGSKPPSWRFEIFQSVCVSEDYVPAELEVEEEGTETLADSNVAESEINLLEH